MSNFILTYLKSFNILLACFLLCACLLTLRLFYRWFQYKDYIYLILGFAISFGWVYFYDKTHFYDNQQKNYNFTWTVCEVGQQWKYIIESNDKKYLVTYSKSLWVGDVVYIFWASKPIKPIEKIVSNLFTFDYVWYLYMKGYSSQISASKIIVIWHKNLWMISTIKEKLKTIIISNLWKNDCSAFLLWTLIWDQSLMSKKLSDNFRSSWLSHILVVSGWNIVLLVVFLSLVLFFLPYYLRLSVILILVFCYAILCGLDSSVLRALITGSIWIIALIFGRPANNLMILKYAYISMLLINPYFLVYDVWFMLSFSAVLWIICAWSVANRISYKNNFLRWFIKDLSAPTLWASFSTLPVLLIYFWSLNLWSIIINILVAPVVWFYMISWVLSSLISEFLWFNFMILLHLKITQYFFYIVALFANYWLFINSGVFYVKMFLIFFVYSLIFWFIKAIKQD